MSDDDRLKTYLRRLTTELQATKQELRAERDRRSEPIAIIGMGCRYPGHSDDPESFWQFLARGADGMTGIPDDRSWDLGALSAHEGVLEGGFLTGAYDFDPAFFGINPREAQAMDPHQRLVLMAAWEAMEGAGTYPEQLADATVGVFSGVMYQDYLSKRSRPPAELADYLSVGGSNSVVPGRVSYTFGFDGPSVAVDTACSSSLVALHLAVRSLRSRECDTAFVTGGMVMSTPAAFESYVIDGALSATGRCRAFSEDADGTAWGEGVGVLMLEPLSVALDRGREVLAVVRGTAINQDGRSSGLTAPNGPSQRRVIEAALADAGLEAGDVDVIEAHGTGTRLGDPIEAGALHSVYGRAHSPADPVHLGSVKSNIGHTQAAAGVASVIKMVQSLRHESLAPTLWVNEPSPRIEWDGSIELLTAPRPWIRGERVRRAGVSGFGFSGTNAHVLLEEAPAVARDVSSEDPPQRTVGESSAPGEAPTPIVLSAASASALAAQARRYGDWLASPAAASVTPGQLASALAGTRKRFRHRLGLCPPDLATAGELLRSAGAGTLDGVRTGEAVEGRGVVFVFPGQGAQWDGMGARLLDQSEVFRGAVAACAAAFGPELGFDLREELRQPMDGDAARVQPLLFAMSIGLARLWESVGVRPDAVVAASLGEPAALHVAGALTLEQAAAVALRRARLLATMPGDLRMLVCQLSSAAATDLLAEMGLSDSVDQLVENSPQNILLGGAEDEIRRIAALLDERGVWCRPLKDARLASHSRWVDPLRDDFLAQLSAISPTKASIPVYSATFGRRVDTASLDAGFWFDNARGRVRMREALDAVFSDGYACLVECSPHPVMHLAIEETAEAGGHRCGVVASIHRGDGGLDDFTRDVTGLAVIADVDLEGSPSRADDRPVALPTYAFDTTRLFHDSVDPDLSGAGLSHTEHPVLGAAVQVAGDRAAVLLGRFSLADQPWLSGHRVDGRILVPGVAFLELSLFAGMRLGCDRIDELVLTAPLDVTVGARQVQVVLEPVEGNPASRRVTISSRRDRDDDWQDHATGTLSSRRGPGPDTAEPIEMGSVVDGEELYDAFAERGITYGDPFRGVTRTGETPGAVHAEVVLAEHERPDGFLLHPALMDASLHALGRAFADSGETGVPYVFSGVEVYAEKATTLRVDLSTTGDATARIRAYDPAGHPVFLIDRIEVRALPAASAVDRVRGAGDLYVLDWRSYTGTTDTRRPDRVLDVDVAGGDAVRACDELLPVFQEWLESDGGLLLVRTVGAHGRPDPATAALQGIVRAAQQEHPGRLQLVDVDVDAATGITEFPRALDEAVVVDGRVLARHLRKVETVAATDVRFEPGSTALISGGGAIGAVIAEQLVRRHGVQRILIGSRGGADSEANTRLAETLRELGAEVDITAVDLGDLRSVRAMVSRVPDEHPIGVVVHTAGVLDDGVLASMGADRLRRVFTPKLTAVENLHRALSDRSVERFVVCSSAASVFGPPGQANYTAANAALDAWCAGRAAEGFPALSLAWGPWEAETTRASAHAGSRTGLAPYRSDTGAEAFSRALAADAGPVLFPLALDRPELRRQAETGGAHELLEELLGPRPSAGPRIAARAASTTGSVDDLVRGVSDVVASVLGHGPGEPLDDRSAFRDLGIDSLTALQVRNRLAAMFDVTLPVSLVFDHPNIRAVATLLRELASGEESDDSRPVTTDRRDLDGERVAIVSMACRYPGGVTSPEGLWDLVEGGVNAVGPMPTDRGWELSELIDPTGTRPGTSLVGTGAFVDSPFDFDPALFSISPREALAMDPVQRLSLELAWEALEQAGIAPDSLAGSATGVYLGVMYQDYGSRFDVVPPQMQAYVGNGNAPSVASGRISYTFGLNGPALTVDTACSSSLVAIHLACRSLLEGETDLALAGGGTIMSTPALFINFSGIRGISSDGACHTFSERADGAGLGEGVGLVALERLSDAERLGHPVLAVIEGSAVNQDGASNGLTAPNGPAQQKVIAAALEQAGLAPSDVDLVEAHGTATPLGDPIEVEALARAYGRGRDADSPLRIGSIKSNIAHTQAAAGVAGLIKVVEALAHETMPATLRAEPLSTRIDWAAGGVEVLTSPVPWPRGDRARRGAVSAFGISGTNAHVILGEAPARAVSPALDDEPGLARLGPLVVTGHTPDSAGTRARLLADALETSLSGEPIEDVAAALVASQSRGRHAIAVAGSREQIVADLRTAGTHAVTPGRMAFHFPGQGSQRALMGEELREGDPVFAAAIDEIAQILLDDTDLAVDLRDVLADESGSWLEDPVWMQVGIVAVQLAQTRLLDRRGIRADAVLGHSLGLIPAAWHAGVLDTRDAVRLTVFRARLMGGAAPGAMLAVQGSEDDVRERLRDAGGAAEIASVNGPSSVVVSGSVDDIDTAATIFGDRRTKRLDTPLAAHSRLLDPVLDELAAFADTLTHSTPRIPVLSNIDGQPIPEFSGRVWAEHLRCPVRYSDGLRWLRDNGVRVHLELGSRAPLTPLVRELLPDDVVIPVCQRDHSEAVGFVRALGTVAATGFPVDWSAFHPRATADLAGRLPRYPFEHSRYWLPGTTAPATTADTPLLRSIVTSAVTDETIGQSVLDVRQATWLADHRVGGTVIAPGTLLVELALETGSRRQLTCVDELVIERPVVLPEDRAVNVQITIQADGSTLIHVDDDGRWQQVASGRLSADPAGPEDTPAPHDDGTRLDATGIYELLSDGGIDYGPAFRCLAGAVRTVDELVVELEPRESTPEAPFVLHPVLLDAALHGLGLTDVLDAGSARLPFSWQGVRVHVPGAVPVTAHVDSPDGTRLRVRLRDEQGVVVAEVGELVLRSAGAVTSLPLATVRWHRTDGAPTASPSSVEVPPCGADAEEIADLLSWLAGVLDEHTAAGSAIGTLTVLTRRGVTTDPGEPVDIAHAAAAGLLRAAGQEHPGSFRLVDLADGSQAAGPFPDVPEVAIRGGQAWVPSVEDLGVPAEPVDRRGTALIVGGGGVALDLARHLAATGSERICIASRRGADAPGVGTLLDELGGRGIAETVDATDPAAMRALVGRVGQPDAVYYTAAVVRDAVLSGLTRDDLLATLSPKVDGARALLDALDPAVVREVCLFSSAAGIVGAAGQSGYAAANCALDALALEYRSGGLPVQSIAWGRWSEAAGAADELTAAQLEAQERSGLRALTNAEAFGVLDAAPRTGLPVLLGLGWNRSGLRRSRRDGVLPPILDMLAGPVEPATSGARGHGDYRSMDPDRRRQALTALVGETVAAVLGVSGGPVESDYRLGDAGFDSLMAIETRNRLAKATGTVLPASLVFDHDTLAGLVDTLAARLDDAPGNEVSPDDSTPSGRTGGASMTISELHQRAVSSGRWEVGFELLRLAAELRPRFDEHEAAANAARVVSLNAATDGPVIFAFHSCIATAGAAQYAKLASVWQKGREVAAVALPGFASGDALPATIEAVVAAQADAVREYAGGRSVVLMGTSAGGWFAQAAAERLVSTGYPVDAVVLVDVYLPDSDFLSRFGVDLMDGMAARSETYEVADDAPLTAMGWYTRLMGPWRPHRTDVRTLFLQASEPLSARAAGTGDDSWKAEWSLPHDLVGVPGNHFTVMESECDSTVAAIELWLAENAEERRP